MNPGALHSATQTEWRLNCPYCHHRRGKPDLDSKLYINKTSHLGHCKKCNWKGSCSSLLSQFLGVDFMFESSLEKFFGTDDRKYRVDHNFIHLDSVSSKITPPYEYSPTYAYLKRRGITDDEIKKYDLRYGTGIYLNRVVVPCFDKTLNCNYIVCRSIDPYEKRKYFNPPESDKSSVLFNQQLLSHQDNVIVCEGVFSAIGCQRAVDRVRSSHVVTAMLGKLISQQQVSILNRSSVSSCTLLLDSDVSEKDIRANSDVLKKHASFNWKVMKTSTGDPENITHADLSEALSKYI